MMATTRPMCHQPPSSIRKISGAPIGRQNATGEDKNCLGDNQRTALLGQGYFENPDHLTKRPRRQISLVVIPVDGSKTGRTLIMSQSTTRKRLA